MSKRAKSSHKHTSRTWAESVAALMVRLSVPAGTALIVVVATWAYFPALRGGFVMDDDRLLTINRLIMAPDGIYRFWCTKESLDYWPVTNTTLWIEWRLWGISPTGYHVTNLTLHIVESLLIWLILWKLSVPGAFWAALIFAVHPVNVESVAWIAQRKNVMAMLFFLLSILCYLKFEVINKKLRAQVPGLNLGNNIHHPLSTAQSPLFYWLSLLAFVLAVLSKGSAVVLPVILLGIIWWHRKVTIWDLIRSVPYFLFAALLAGVNVWFQTHGTGEVFRTASLIERVLGAGSAIWFYLYKVFLPLNLVFIYPQWNIQTGNLLWWLPLLAAIAVTAVLWLYRESWSRSFLFAWGFFCVSLAPVLGFVDVGFMRLSLVADRYLHIAIIGVIALVAAGWSCWHRRAQRIIRWVATVVIILLVAALAFLTRQQSNLYCDALTLYHDTVEKNPDCWIAYYNLGNASYRAGRPQEAIEYYNRAISIKADYHEAHNNLGAVLLEIGRPEEAIAHYRQALRIKPDYALARLNLGDALNANGRSQEAIEQYQEVLRLEPNNTEAQIGLGKALIQSGQMQEAIEH